jgi:hypothetical protein
VVCGDALSRASSTIQAYVSPVANIQAHAQSTPTRARSLGAIRGAEPVSPRTVLGAGNWGSASQGLMKVDAFQKVRTIERQHVGIDLGGLHAAMAEQLAYKLQRPSV